LTDLARKASKIQRILVIDPQQSTAKMLANLLRSIWPQAQIYGAKDNASGMLLAAEVKPDLVFVESAGPNLDGLAFARAYRRSDMDCREAPIILISGDTTAAQILGARDAGIHEFMRRPYTMGDLLKRLEAVSGKSRDWIEAIQYVGPDRRRFNSADYTGPKKRRTDGPVKAQKMSQALKIILSAMDAVDSDPVQCARALATQVRVIIELSNGQEQYRRLLSAAIVLQSYLANAAKHGTPLAKDQIATFAHNIFLAAPESLRPQPQAVA
jgi:response regulator RpfG family c-di-GMP phosphodiesterase